MYLVILVLGLSRNVATEMDENLKPDSPTIGTSYGQQLEDTLLRFNALMEERRFEDAEALAEDAIAQFGAQSITDSMHRKARRARSSESFFGPPTKGANEWAVASVHQEAK